MYSVPVCAPFPGRATPAPRRRPGRLTDHPTNTGRPPVAPYKIVSVFASWFVSSAGMRLLCGLKPLHNAAIRCAPCVRPNPGRRTGLPLQRPGRSTDHPTNTGRPPVAPTASRMNHLLRRLYDSVIPTRVHIRNMI
jgi:hypothetical protein